MKENTLDTALKWWSENGETPSESYTTEDLLRDLVAYADWLQQEEKLSLEDRKRKFYEECKKLVNAERTNTKEVTKFYNYWTEHPDKVKSNTKMRFEKQPTFNIKGRYATWRKQQKRFSIVNMLKR